MATEKQRAANRANARHSTGPRTAEGKARSSRNAATHGCNSGFLTVDPEDRARYNALRKAIFAQAKPVGALENDAVQEIFDSYWRLRQIRKYLFHLATHHGGDPFAVPECAPAVRQLARHRSAAEMSLHRAINALRELQTIRLGRVFHLARHEQRAIGPLASPAVFAFQVMDGVRLGRFSRELAFTFDGPRPRRE